MKKFVIYTGLIVAMICWAITFIWAKQVLNAGVSPTLLIFIRLTVVSFLVLPFFLFTRAFRKIERKDIVLFMLMALFEPFMYFIGEANGIRLVSPNIAAIIIATIPLFLPFFARIFLKEKLKIYNYIGIVVSFIGVLLIIVDKGGKINASLHGLLYLFIAVFSAVGYTILAKSMLDRYSPMFIAVIKVLIAWFYFLPVCAIKDMELIYQVQWDVQILWRIAALGLCGNLIAYFLFNRAIKTIGASKSSIFSNLIPVFTVFFSFILLGETMHYIKLLGMGLTIFGIYITQIQHFKDKKIKYDNY